MIEYPTVRDVRLFIGLVITMIGILAVTFMGLYFIYNNSTVLWIGVTVAVLTAIIVPIANSIISSYKK